MGSGFFIFSLNPSPPRDKYPQKTNHQGHRLDWGWILQDMNRKKKLHIPDMLMTFLTVTAGALGIY